MTVLLAGFLVAGCGRRAGGGAFQPEVVEPSHVVMYLYREPRFGGRTVQVYINQESMGSLRPGQYMVRIGTPGAFLVRVEAESSAAREVRLQPGDAAYLRIAGNAKPVIEEPETEVARREIARTSRVGD
jgi:hypothetical protein